MHKSLYDTKNKHTPDLSRFIRQFQFINIVLIIMRGQIRSIWRNPFVRAVIIMLFVLTWALDPRFGTETFTLLCMTSTSMLCIHFVMQTRQERRVQEQAWTSELDINSEVLGRFGAYALALLALLLLCWAVAFPFSAGQGGGKRLLDGTRYTITTRVPVRMVLKVFLSNIMVIALLLLTRRQTWLNWLIVIFHFLYSFALGGILRSYSNVYGLEHGTFPALTQIMNFPPLAVFSLYALPWLPWLLPAIGFVLICISLAIIHQRRSEVGFILVTRPKLWWAIAGIGLMLFIIGEYRFVQFLRTTYQGYF